MVHYRDTSPTGPIFLTCFFCDVYMPTLRRLFVQSVSYRCSTWTGVNGNAQMDDNLRLGFMLRLTAPNF